MQVADIEKLLVGSILKQQNPNIWKGEYIRCWVDILLNQLSHSGRKSMITQSDLTQVLQQYGYKKVRLLTYWIPSGDEVACYEIITNNLLCKVFFEPQKIFCQVEIQKFRVALLEYGMTGISTLQFIDGLSKIDKKIGDICNNWAELIKNSTKKARLIELTHATAQNYLQQLSELNGFTYTINSTAACVVVEIVADGRCAISDTLPIGCNPKDVIDNILRRVNALKKINF